MIYNDFYLFKNLRKSALRSQRKSAIYSFLQR